MLQLKWNSYTGYWKLIIKCLKMFQHQFKFNIVEVLKQEELSRAYQETV